MEKDRHFIMIKGIILKKFEPQMFISLRTEQKLL